MHRLSPSTPAHDAGIEGPAAAAPLRPGRLAIDAPLRAFHWLFALSFAGAWLTAESERWRALHVTLGYAFAGLLLFRLVYGVIGPRQARLAMLWRRLAGAGRWWAEARAGRPDLLRLATLGMGAAMLALLAGAAPLALSGYGAYIEWAGLEDALEELHEALANLSLTLVVLHLSLIVVLSVARRRNLALPMLSGRIEGRGPDLVASNRRGLAAIVLALTLGFVGWQGWQDLRDAQPGVSGAATPDGAGRVDDDD